MIKVPLESTRLKKLKDKLPATDPEEKEGRARSTRDNEGEVNMHSRTFRHGEECFKRLSSIKENR